MPANLANLPTSISQALDPMLQFQPYPRHAASASDLAISARPDGQNGFPATDPGNTAATLRQRRKEVKKLVASLDTACARSENPGRAQPAQFAYPGDATVSELRHGHAQLCGYLEGGLSAESPALSLSRSTKNALILAGGATTKAASASAIATVATTSAAIALGCAPVTAVFGGVLLGVNSIQLRAIAKNDNVRPMRPAVRVCADTARGLAVGAALPLIGVKSILQRDGPLARQIHDHTIAPLRRISLFTNARQRVDRPRLSTDAIARDCEARVSAELQRYTGRTANIAPPETPIARPHWLLRRLTARRWHFPETEENASAFNLFQAGIADTNEYKNVMARPALVHRVDVLVDAMSRSAALRGTCFAIAAEALDTCSDGIALALNDMDAALVDQKAQTGQFSMHDLYATGLDQFKLQLIEEVATQKMRMVPSVALDEIEVRLAYQTVLAARLGLPCVVRSMLYRRYSNVSDIDIDVAESIIRARFASAEQTDWLAQWLPWRKALERSYPSEHAYLHAMIASARDALSVAPEGMTDQQWIDALAQAAEQEKTMTAGLAKKMTRRFQSNHRALIDEAITHRFAEGVA